MKINWFRELVSNFSQIDGFDGWLIAKVEFDILEIDKFSIGNMDLHIVKSRKNYVVINICRYCSFDACNFSCNMTIYLVKPYDINKIKLNKQMEIYRVCISENLFFKSVYTEKDIENFVKDIGDKNYIHKIDNPVVPGFLMLEDMMFKILGEIKETGKSLDSKGLHIEIIFYNPLYSNETVKVYSEILDAKKNLNKENSIKYTAIRNGGIEICIFEAMSKLIL